MIKTESKDRVLRIEIARPEKKNALTQEMYAAMADALAAADGDPQVRVALIHGARAIASPPATTSRISSTGRRIPSPAPRTVSCAASRPSASRCLRR